MSQFAVILPAAGRSSRYGDPREKKIFADLAGRAVWLRAAGAFLNRDDVARVIVAIAPEDRELFDRRYQANTAFLNIRVVIGGADRSETVARALEAVEPECDYVAVHDAARPCLSTEVVDRVFAAALKHGAAVPAVPVADTIKRMGPDGMIAATVPRESLHLAQTPQVFRRELLCRAIAERSRLGRGATDCAGLVEALGHPCAIVMGSPLNLKITTPLDLKLAAAILPLVEPPRRDGPAHPFADEQQGWEKLPRIKPRDLFGP